jgi:serine/threonine protein kinase
MHNFTPALLHRDLKVENILQASQTSFKLCDFGSTAPAAAKPPSTTAEIRALEADINRHTTMQYRAPEMVDVYLRRPIDEKSGEDPCFCHDSAEINWLFTKIYGLWASYFTNCAITLLRSRSMAPLQSSMLSIRYRRIQCTRVSSMG